MYKAILHGKYRGIDKGRQDALEEDEVSYRSLYSGMEDFLTAGVFTRLSYLDPHSLRGILRETFEGEEFKKSNSMSNAGNLNDIQFWPSWKDKCGHRVEPDVFLKFENINIIVEAKFGDAGNPQDDDQWCREWEGMKNLDYSEQDRKNTWLFAIGGISDKNSFARWADEIVKDNKNKIVKDNKNPHFKFAFAGWQDLYDVLKKEQSPNRIIEDTISILEFHGYHTPVWLGELPDKIREDNPYIDNNSICFFVKQSYEYRPLWRTYLDWNEMLAPYPISPKSLTTLQEKFPCQI